MSKNVIPEVREEFVRYCLLMADFKATASNPLTTQKSKCGRYEVAKVSLSHPDPFHEIELEIRFTPAVTADYEFKLFWREVVKTPVFRFETWGDAHNNLEDGDGLPSRKIPTPHFHKVKSNGRVWAYRTAALDQEGQEVAIRENYSLGVKHFCQEAKIHDSNGGDVIVDTSRILTQLSTTDPLNGVSFR